MFRRFLPLPILLLAACQAGTDTVGGGGGSGVPPTPPAFPPPAPLDGGVWMKGDLHLHSDHSSDAADNPLPILIDLAETVGMDYFLITDHDNHVNGDIAGNTWADPAYRSDSMVMLYGAEWTTHRGHGDTISALPYDHQRFYDARDALDTEIGALADELGFHFSANHPSGDDHWGFSLDIVDSIEVWNSAIWSTNAAALMVWDDQLKAGRKVTGRGGSDAHHSYTAPAATWTSNVYQGFANNVGTPTTWVYARERSADAVVQALTAGRVAISATSASARVEFSADLDADGEADLMMGDVGRASGQPVSFRVDLADDGNPLGVYSVRVIKDGAEFGVFRTAGSSVSFTDTPPADARSYYRVEVQGLPAPYPQVPGAVLLAAGTVGLSNPIYFNFQPLR